MDDKKYDVDYEKLTSATHGLTEGVKIMNKHINKASETNSNNLNDILEALLYQTGAQAALIGKSSKLITALLDTLMKEKVNAAIEYKELAELIKTVTSTIPSITV